MATFEQGTRSSISGLVTTARVLSILVFTGVETAALALWLSIVEGVTVASLTATVGLGILVVGLGIEHLLTDVTVNGLNLSAPVWTILGLSVSEAVLWAIWLAVAETATGLGGYVLAATVLAVLLVPQHTVEDNALRGTDPFSSILDLGTIGFSIIESVGATIWLVLVFDPALVIDRLPSGTLGGFDPATVGLALLALALFVEHNIAVTYSRGR